MLSSVMPFWFPDEYGYIIPTVYYWLVEDKRPDIRLLESHGLLLNDRVVQSLWNNKRKTAGWDAFADNAERPFYYQNHALINQTGLVCFEFILKTDNSLPTKTAKLEINDSEKSFFKKMIALSDTRDR